MFCRVNDLKHKIVINVRNGSRLGSVADVELDTVSAKVQAVAVRGRLRLLGILGREEDVVIPWSNIEVIGEDTILINYELPVYDGKKRGRFFRILSDE